MKITIGIPAYNEEKNIAKIITKLKKITDSIIVCDDGSSDMTSEIAKNLGVIVISHKKNMGYGAAIRTIFEKSAEIDSDILVTFDADGQHRIEDVSRVLHPLENNEADIVIGSRFLGKQSNVPNYRKLGIKVITQVTNSSIKTKLTDSQSGFRAYSKQVLSKISLSEVGMGISTEILIKASSEGLRITEVPITILYSGDTSTHNPVSHGTSVLFSTIKFTSIEHPLKFYGIPSVIFLTIGVIFTSLAVQYYVDVGRLNTDLTLIGAGTILVGIILLISAILLYSLVSVVREKR
uniref:Glycosyl transferase family protein n=1 Tax=uncultured marine thaumarchaeote AD1000_82_B05 TaxID=1455944 RepID=A0A075FZ65_9ARCH|nr:glycosyl transferase family protein [uncultured marine thaumarchaeote AD1000_82_B05]|tara:strand:- start:356 stop:1234 length:879 start_codon:yes stop_codon:yes gene_type:complete